MRTCQHCLIYEEIPNKFRLATRIGEKITIYKRKCIFSKEFIPEDTEACEHYKPGNLFWCSENEQWLHQTVCIARQKKKHEDCPRNCIQGKSILSGRRGYRPIVENGNNVVLPIRRKRNDL